MQNRNFAPATEFIQNLPLNHMRQLITNYIRFTHCNADLIWEKNLRADGTQLISQTMEHQKAQGLLDNIKQSEISDFNVLFFIAKSSQDQTKHRIIFSLAKLDLTATTAIADLVKQKMHHIAFYLNVIHRPDKNTPWKINQELQLLYESDSLSYVSRDGDIQKATQICDLLYTGLSPAAKAQGLTFDFTEAMGKSLTKHDGRGKCYYVLEHNEFVWKNLSRLASDFYTKKLVMPITANTCKPSLDSDSSRCLSFFLDTKSILALALTNKDAAKVLDTPEAKQLFRKQ